MRSSDAPGLGTSVLGRMLAVSLAVAACSIAATAWLTTRSTSSHLQTEISRTLDADNRIYQGRLMLT